MRAAGGRRDRRNRGREDGTPGSGCFRSRASARTGSTRPRGAELREDLGDWVASAIARDVSHAVGFEGRNGPKK